MQAPQAPHLIQGCFGAVKHTILGVPPCVWIHNKTPMPIKAVVSRDGPQRLLTGVNAQASSSGAGFNLESEVTLGYCVQDLLSYFFAVSHWIHHILLLPVSLPRRLAVQVYVEIFSSFQRTHVCCSRSELVPRERP